MKRFRIAAFVASACLWLLPGLAQAAIAFSNESTGWAWVTVYWPTGSWGGMDVKAHGCMPPRTRGLIGDGGQANTPYFTFNTPVDDFKVRVELTSNRDCQHPVVCDSTWTVSKIAPSQYPPSNLWITFKSNPQSCWFVIHSSDATDGWKMGSIDAPGQPPPETPPPPPPPPTPALAPSGPAYLAMGQSLTTNQFLQSANNRYYAIVQTDGNLCVYRGTPQATGAGGAIWCLQRTAGGGQFVLAMQSDGNLCEYVGTRSGYSGNLWCSNTRGQNFLVQQNDGNLCVYRGASPANQGAALWCHNTNVGR